MNLKSLRRDCIPGLTGKHPGTFHKTLTVNFAPICMGRVGALDARSLVCVAPPLKYPLCSVDFLTFTHNGVGGKCLVVVLTGGFSSQRERGEQEGGLNGFEPRGFSAWIKAPCFARCTFRGGAKPGNRFPVFVKGRAFAQGIKETPGIRALPRPSFYSHGGFGPPNSALSHLGAEAGPRGRVVRLLKWSAMWFKTSVRQLAPSGLWAWEI